MASRFELNLEKLVCVCTNGAPALIAKSQGFVARLKKYQSEKGIEQKLFSYHCILHQGNLCAKAIEGEYDVLKTVTEIYIAHLSFCRTASYEIWNSYPELRFFPSDNQPNSIECVASSPFQVVMYFITIRWLSCGKVLNRFYEMLTEIGQFVEQQKMEAQFELITPAWKHELFFFMALLITSMN